MSKSVVKLFALAMVLTTMVACSKTRGDHQDNTSQFSSQSGTDVNGRKVVTAIANEALAKKNLTDEQLTTLSSYADSRDMLVRLQVMSALRNAGSQHAQAACTIARMGLASTDSMTRLYALTTLDKLNPSDITSIAKKMTSDQSHYVTPEAHRILKERGADS